MNRFRPSIRSVIFAANVLLLGMTATASVTLVSRAGTHRTPPDQPAASNNPTLAAVAEPRREKKTVSARSTPRQVRPRFAVVLPGKTWSPENAQGVQGLTGGNSILNASGVPITGTIHLAPGESVTLTAPALQDYDKWTQGSESAYELDELVYAWSASKGTFSSATAASTTWTAPSAMEPGVTRQSVTLNLTVNDKPLDPTSGRDDTGTNASRSLNVTVIYGPKDWDAAPAVTGAEWIQPADAEETEVLTVLSGATISLEVGEGVDEDTWEYKGQTDTEADTVHYQWSSDNSTYPGSFDAATARSTHWTAPVLPTGTGSLTMTLTCHVADAPAAVPTGEAGARDDDNDGNQADGEELKRTLVVKVVRKQWTKDHAIGQKRVLNGTTETWEEDGRMTAPQNQAASSTDPVVVHPAQQVTCEVETATDLDKWTDPSGSDYDPDEVQYRWTMVDNQGRFLVAQPGGGTTLETYATTRQATWVAPEGLTTDTTVTLRCTISDTPKAIAPDEGGSREDDKDDNQADDLVRSCNVTVKAAAPTTRIQVYEPDTGGNLVAAADGDWIGDEVKVGLVVDVGPGQRVASDVDNVIVRVREDANESLAEQHPSNLNRMRLVYDFTPSETGWQLWNDPDGDGNGEWVASSSPREANLTGSVKKYRLLRSWDTRVRTDSPDPDGEGGLNAVSLLGHNGDHALQLTHVNYDDTNPVLRIEQMKMDGTWGLPLAPETAVRSMDVRNLVINNVTTNNGTPYYFKYDPASTDEALSQPTVSFAVGDRGSPHHYRWKVRIRNTASITWDGILIQGEIDEPGPVTAHINDAEAEGQTQTNNAGTAQASLSTKGTYTFDIEVQEIDTNGNLLGHNGDGQLYRSTVTLPAVMPGIVDAQGHAGSVHTDENGDQKYYVNYYIQDDTLGLIEGSEAASLQVQMLSPDMNSIIAQNGSDWSKALNTVVRDKCLYTFPSQNLHPGPYRTTFTAVDSRAGNYRNHTNRPTLTHSDEALVTFITLTTSSPDFIVYRNPAEAFAPVAPVEEIEADETRPTHETDSGMGENPEGELPEEEGTGEIPDEELPPGWEPETKAVDESAPAPDEQYDNPTIKFGVRVVGYQQWSATILVYSMSEGTGGLGTPVASLTTTDTEVTWDDLFPGPKPASGVYFYDIKLNGQLDINEPLGVDRVIGLEGDGAASERLDTDILVEELSYLVDEEEPAALQMANLVGKSNNITGIQAQNQQSGPTGTTPFQIRFRLKSQSGKSVSGVAPNLRLVNPRLQKVQNVQIQTLNDGSVIGTWNYSPSQRSDLGDWTVVAGGNGTGRKGRIILGSKLTVSNTPQIEAIAAGYNVSNNGGQLVLPGSYNRVFPTPSTAIFRTYFKIRWAGESKWYSDFSSAGTNWTALSTVWIGGHDLTNGTVLSATFLPSNVEQLPQSWINLTGIDVTWRRFTNRVSEQAPGTKRWYNMYAAEVGHGIGYQRSITTGTMWWGSLVSFERYTWLKNGKLRVQPLLYAVPTDRKKGNNKAVHVYSSGNNNITYAHVGSNGQSQRHLWLPSKSSATWEGRLCGLLPPGTVDFADDDPFFDSAGRDEQKQKVLNYGLLSVASSFNGTPYSWSGQTYGGLQSVGSEDFTNSTGKGDVLPEISSSIEGKAGYGIDCSGLIVESALANNIPLPLMVGNQRAQGPNTGGLIGSMYGLVYEFNQSEPHFLRPGDYIVWSGAADGKHVVFVRNAPSITSLGGQPIIGSVNTTEADPDKPSKNGRTRNRARNHESWDDVDFAFRRFIAQ